MSTTNRRSEPNRPTPGADGSVRKAHYGEGKQPWDYMVEVGWGPVAAASNAFKYVKRYTMKNGEDDLEKGRWYLARLLELLAAETAKWGASIHGPAYWAHYQLECLITRQEYALLLNKESGK